MDATCITVRCAWLSVDRVVDQEGQTLDFMLSEMRDTKAGKLILANALSSNVISRRITTDKSCRHAAGIAVAQMNCTYQFGAGRCSFRQLSQLAG